MAFSIEKLEGGVKDVKDTKTTITKPPKQKRKPGEQFHKKEL